MTKFGSDDFSLVTPLFMQGVTFHQQGNLDLARSVYEQVLTLQPQHFDALHLLGVIEHQNHRYQRGIDLITKALNVKPDSPGAWCNLGMPLAELGRYEDALICYERAITLRPDFAEAYFNRGNTLMRLQRTQEAVTSFERALVLRPLHAKSHYNLGTALQELKRFDESIASFKKAITILPEFPEAFSNLANSLLELGSIEAALEACNSALSLKPDFADAHSNRGNALYFLGLTDQALISYELAIKHKPEFADAFFNRGNALRDLGRQEDAILSYERALELNPNLVDARFSWGQLKLAQKKWAEGWGAYFHRKHIKRAGIFAHLNDIASWQLDSPKGRLLVLAEQGIGDEIFLTKCLELLIQRNGTSICVAVDHRLLLVFERSFTNINFISRSDLSQLNSKAFDFQINVGDAAAMLVMNPVMHPQVCKPHILISDKKPSFLTKLQSSKSLRPRVGLSWKSKSSKIGAEKSMSLLQMMTTLKDLKVDWINLQYGDVISEIEQVKTLLDIEVHQVSGVNIDNDLDEWLQVIEACDAVITTSNSTAHFSGAIGKPTFVMVPFGKGKLWYWHLEDGPSEWYPSLSVAHAKELNVWGNTLIAARSWLEKQIQINQ